MLRIIRSLNIVCCRDVITTREVGKGSEQANVDYRGAEPQLSGGGTNPASRYC